jgi:hypothetical protein
MGKRSLGFVAPQALPVGSTVTFVINKNSTKCYKPHYKEPVFKVFPNESLQTGDGKHPHFKIEVDGNLNWQTPLKLRSKG